MAAAIALSLSLDEIDAFATAPTIGETASGRLWRFREAPAATTLALAQRWGLHPFIARALAARGVRLEDAADYLSPSLRKSMPDPFALRDMDRAVARLAAAVIKGEGVGVFGDYDVDGTTAASILHLYLRAVGLAVPVYLPDRIAEGYGPSLAAFRRLREDGVGIIVTVDCGAAAHDVIDAAVAEGLEVIVVDHHLMSGPPPARAVAVVNPNRADDFSGLTNLSAAGLAFMLAAALNRSLREAGRFRDQAEPDLLSLLDLAALGLVCDVMPMTGLARVFVAQGLKVLATGGNKGLAALAARAGAKERPTAYDLGFLLGPRINAAGRIGHADLAFELLTTADAERRTELAERLHVLNAERQAIEAAVFEAAVADVERRGVVGRRVVVTAGEGWHPGVVGIVAGRLKERYDRPAVVIGLAAGVGKGSGRSIDGVDLGAAVAAARAQGIATSGGGHAMAAGLTAPADAIEALDAFLEARLGEEVDRAIAGLSLVLDGVLDARAVTRRLADDVAAAGPFGPGNPEPTVVLRDMSVRDLRPVGAGHLAARLESMTGQSVRAIAFRAKGERLEAFLTSGRRLHVAGRVRADEWKGLDAGQLHIVDAAMTVGSEIPSGR